MGSLTYKVPASCNLVWGFLATYYHLNPSVLLYRQSMPPRSVPRGSQRGGGPQRGGPASRGSRGGHGGAARVGTQVGLPSTAGEPKHCRYSSRTRGISINIAIKRMFKRLELSDQISVQLEGFLPFMSTLLLRAFRTRLFAIMMVRSLSSFYLTLISSECVRSWWV